MLFGREKVVIWLARLGTRRESWRRRQRRTRRTVKSLVIVEGQLVWVLGILGLGGRREGGRIYRGGFLGGKVEGWEVEGKCYWIWQERKVQGGQKVR